MTSGARIMLLSALQSGIGVGETLLAAGIDVAGVISVDHAYREASGMRPGYFADLGSWSAEHSIQCREVSTLKDLEIQQWIAHCRPDWIIAVGWPLIVPRTVRALARRGTLGAHPSLLPKRRGGAPLNWALIDGLPESGVTILALEDEVDAGPIAWQRAFRIQPNDEVGDLMQRVADLLAAGFADLADQLRAGRVHLTPQDATAATWTRRRRPEDGAIHWSATSMQIQNLVRALAPPFPGASTVFRGELLVIERTRAVQGVRMRPMPPGTIYDTDPLTVATGDFLLELHQVDAGGGDEDGVAWARRTGVSVGELLK